MTLSVECHRPEPTPDLCRSPLVSHVGDWLCCEMWSNPSLLCLSKEFCIVALLLGERSCVGKRPLFWGKKLGSAQAWKTGDPVFLVQLATTSSTSPTGTYATRTMQERWAETWTFSPVSCTSQEKQASSKSTSSGRTERLITMTVSTHFQNERNMHAAQLYITKDHQKGNTSHFV